MFLNHRQAFNYLPALPGYHSRYTVFESELEISSRMLLEINFWPQFHRMIDWKYTGHEGESRFRIE